MSSKLDKLREERQKLKLDESRLSKQRSLLDGLAEKIGSGVAPQADKKDGAGLFEITDSHLNGLDKFFGYFVNRTSKLDEELTQVEKKIKLLDEEIRVLEGNLHECRYGNEERYLSR